MPEIELELLTPVQGGQMLARLEGQVVFVHGGIAGETVRVEAPARKRGYLEADARSILTPDQARVAPPCPYFGENTRRRGSVVGTPGAPGPVCGGCQYQHIAYQTQLDFKQTILRETLRRVGKILDAPVAAPVASPHPYGYRNKAAWLITEEGEPAYHVARSHDAVAIASCHLLTPSLHAVLETLRRTSGEIGLAGLVRGVEARVLPDGAGVEQGSMILDLAPATTDHEAEALAEALREVCPSIISVAGRRAPLNEPWLLAGVERIGVAFLDELLALSPATFFQVNLPVAEAMGRHVLTECGALAERQILDLYSGAGALTIPIARQADAVIAMELDAGAVADARGNVAHAGLENVSLLAGDAAASLRAILPGTIDAVVLDPPRSGCSPDALRQLARVKAPRLVYVSCDAATLARDLRGLLDQGYVLERVQPFDLFPQTAHIESVSTLRLPKKYQARR